MNKFKLIMSYVLGFCASVLLVILSILLVFRFTVYNENYILKTLDNQKYYKKASDEIKKDMTYNLHSSGLDNAVLEGIYEETDVKQDIKSYITAMYSGYKYDVKTDKIKEKLEKNIDNYLKEKKLEVEDRKSLDKYTEKIVKTYENEVNLYGYLDGLVIKIYKLGKVLDSLVVGLIILISTLLVIEECVLGKKYFGVTFLSASLMLLYFRYFIYEKIDFKNILIVSNNFSKVVRKVLTDIGDKMLIVSIILIIISIILIIKDSIKKVKRVKRSSH